MSDLKAQVECDIDQIVVNENVRGSATASPSLVASILKHGIIEPLVVKGHKDGFELIAGARRLDGARQAGLETVPISIKFGGVSEPDRIGMQVAENLHRENLTDWELAQAALDLKDEGLKQAEVAHQMGVTAKDVSQLQKAGKSELSDEQGNALSLGTLLEIADTAKQTEYQAEDLASALINGEARDMYGAIRHVEWEIEEVTLIEELVQLQGEWAELGITVTMDAPNATDKKDRHGYEVKDKNVLRVVESEGHGGSIVIPLVEHIKLDCHTIQLQPAKGFGHTTWTHWCTNVKRHKAKGDSELKATNTKTSGTAMSDVEKEDRREQREAKKLRTQQAGQWLRKLPSAKDQKAMGTFHALSDSWKAEHTRGVVLALIADGEVEPRPKGAEYNWYSDQLLTYLDSKFGDDHDKQDSWKVKALDAFDFIEHRAHWTYRTEAWEQMTAIEVNDGE